MAVKKTDLHARKFGIRWQVFPRNKTASEHQIGLIKLFEDLTQQISTPKNRLQSNEVLAVLRPSLIEYGYQVEGKGEKVERPVLYGESGKKEKLYYVDGWDQSTGTVLEVEAGQAVENNRFAIDILKACSIQDAKNLVMAIPANYHPERLRKANKKPKKAFDSVVLTLDGLYSANRVQLPLDSILVIGY